MCNVLDFFKPVVLVFNSNMRYIWLFYTMVGDIIKEYILYILHICRGSSRVTFSTAMCHKLYARETTHRNSIVPNIASQT